VTINVIKYCNNIKIPEILIENKNEVDRARKKIFEEEIYSFL
tara:strand:+ start:549 stop:674 length:126 start_codon:yes stop_codon:yes gene_type:complete